MKTHLSTKWVVWYYMLILPLALSAQNTTDILFTAFNADGDDDFAIVVLKDLPPNTLIYFTDKEPDGMGGLTTGEGILHWNTGAEIVPSGTSVVFTDVDSDTNPLFGVSHGTLSNGSGSFNLSGTGDALFAYVGADENTPTQFLAGIQNTTSASVYNTLEGTGLIIGESFIMFTDSGTPDGGAFTGQKFGKKSFTEFIQDLNNNSLWKQETSNGELIFPLDTMAFSIHTIQWNGSLSNDIHDPNNWTPSIVPSATSDIFVPNNVNFYPTSSTSLLYKGITLDSEATWKNTGNIEAPIQFRKQLNTTLWYLIGMPVHNETFEELISYNSFAVGTDTHIGMASYDANQHAWLYESSLSSGSISIGSGFAFQLKDSTLLKIYGSLNATSSIQIPLSASTHQYNLVANPYPTYVNINDFFQENDSVLVEKTIWSWNSVEKNFTQYNETSGYILSPGEGFFVKTFPEATSISFDTSLQKHFSEATNKSLDTNQRKISLTLSSGDQQNTTSIVFSKKASLSFDNGLDSSVFNEATDILAIYTQIATKSNSQYLGIQSLPIDRISNISIPLGITASKNSTINLTMNTSQLPEHIGVYLFDTEEYKLRQLTRKNSIKLSTKEALKGFGKYLLIIKEIMNPTDNIIRAYQSSTTTISLVGVDHLSIEIGLYNLDGKILLKRRMNEEQVKNIQLPTTLHGLYFIKIISKDLTKSVPIILE